MRKLLLPVLVVCATFQSKAQAPKQDYMVVPIVSQQSFYLKAGAGYNSGEILPINLPANTVKWYYTITTMSGHGSFANNDLTGQLVKLVDPNHGIAADASVTVPRGTGLCDVFLMTNPNEAIKYVNKQPAISFLMNDSREHFISGAVPVNDYLDGSCFMVIRNPGYSRGVNINIEVTAIVLSSSVGSSTAMQ
jgi:hypothetical protein